MFRDNTKRSQVISRFHSDCIKRKTRHLFIEVVKIFMNQDPPYRATIISEFIILFLTTIRFKSSEYESFKRVLIA